MKYSQLRMVILRFLILREAAASDILERIEARQGFRLVVLTAAREECTKSESENAMRFRKASSSAFP